MIFSDGTKMGNASKREGRWGDAGLFEGREDNGCVEWNKKTNKNDS